jgi:hypothetical protein
MEKSLSDARKNADAEKAARAKLESEVLHHVKKLAPLF